MGFVDEVTVFVRAGKGGAGSTSLLREPYKPRGGPDGGDGGPGGSVILEVSDRETDLSALADRPHRRAENGGAGASNNRTGAAGADLVIEVPDGTVIREGDDLVADLV
ncbi:MAG: GTPase ObgE, partial [Actinomycetota bacterium]|nr:GTPase ObgE [Actinomycetota bacterium]